jgi:hypothetical protein
MICRIDVITDYAVRVRVLYLYSRTPCWKFVGTCKLRDGVARTADQVFDDNFVLSVATGKSKYHRRSLR